MTYTIFDTEDCAELHAMDEIDLGLLLIKHKWEMPSSLQVETLGITTVDPKEQQFIVSPTKGLIACKVKHSKKAIPASLFREKVRDAELEFRETNSRSPKKSEKTEIKEKITEALIAQALPNLSEHYVIIDNNNHLIAVECPHSKAESILSLLRTILGSLKTKYLQTEEVVVDTMRNILLFPDDYDHIFQPASNCKLANEEGETITYARHEELDNAVENLDGSTSWNAVELGLEGKDFVFTLTDKCEIKGLKSKVKMDGDIYGNSILLASFFKDVAHILK